MISLSLSAVATWPRIIRVSAGRAMTTYSADRLAARLKEGAARDLKLSRFLGSAASAARTITAWEKMDDDPQ